MYISLSMVNIRRITLICVANLLILFCSCNNKYNVIADKWDYTTPESIMDILYPVSIGQWTSVENGVTYITAKAGYIDRNGKWLVISDEIYTGSGYYNKMQPITSELLPATNKYLKKAGYIDREGKWKIYPVYDSVNLFFNGLAYVTKGEWQENNFEQFYIDEQGNIVIDGSNYYAISSEFSEGLAWAISNNEKGFYLGYINLKGEWEIPPSFSYEILKTIRCKDDLSNNTSVKNCNFNNGLALLQLDGLYGYIDRTGNWVVPPLYQDALVFSDDVAPVCVDDKWGFIDKTGNWLIKPQYTAVQIFSEGMAAVFDNNTDKWGFINKNGDWVIKPIFSPIGPEKSDYYLETTAEMLDTYIFRDGLAIARDSESWKWGYINQSGEWVIRPAYSHAYHFNEGVASVAVDVNIMSNRGGTRGYIDVQGNWIMKWEDTY